MLNHNDEYLIEEKIKWNERSLQGIEVDSNISGRPPQYIEIDRNLKDDTFNILAPGRVDHEDVMFTVNNQLLNGVVSAKEMGGYTQYSAHRSLFKNEELSKVTEITVRQNEALRGGKMAYSISLFPQIESMNKNIYLEPGQYIKLRAINKIRLIAEPNRNDENSKVTIDGKLKTKVYYNTTYIVPRKFDPIKGNATLFDIYTKNDSPEDDDYKGDDGIFADYSTADGKLSTSTLSKSGMTTHFQPSDQTETVQEEKDDTPAVKVGEVQLFDNQFYNYDSKKVETGYGKDSVKGLLVPYDFSGEFKESVKFTPNEAFKDLNVYMSHDIDQPLLNKYDGKIVLNIKEVREAADNFRTIPSDKIRMLADFDPTISGLERISNEEDL